MLFQPLASLEVGGCDQVKVDSQSLESKSRNRTRSGDFLGLPHPPFRRNHELIEAKHAKDRSKHDHNRVSRGVKYRRWPSIQKQNACSKRASVRQG
jgi:hypothetical protein